MNAIVAADRNWGIGRDHKLLVHLPGDLKYFKEKTIGKVLIMGRKTLESLPGGKPLPGRTTVVLTGNPSYVPEALRELGGQTEAAEKNAGGAIDQNGTKLLIAHSQEELYTVLLALEFTDGIDLEEDVFVAGGESVYADMYPYCSRFFVTAIDAEFEADRHFINMDKMEAAGKVKKVSESEPIEEKGVKYSFRVYERV